MQQPHTNDCQTMVCWMCFWCSSIQRMQQRCSVRTSVMIERQFYNAFCRGSHSIYEGIVFVRRILLDIYLYMSHVYNYIISITPSSECWYIYSNMHASPKHFVEINCANMRRFIIPSVSFTTGNIDMSQALSFWILDSFRLWLQAQVCLLPTDRSSQCMAHRQVMPLEDKTYPTKARAFLLIYAHQAHWMYIVYIPNV